MIHESFMLSGQIQDNDFFLHIQNKMIVKYCIRLIESTIYHHMFPFGKL